MSWLNALGWAGSALLIFSLLQARVLRFRLLNLLACIVLVVFNGILGIWPMVAMNVALAGINLWFIRKLLSERHSDVAFEVLEVGPSDAYLRHTLRVHADDIQRFQPGFAWNPVAPGHTAYLVERGDETVGIVLVRDEGGGVAQVELDYVTPRFRDFSPGGVRLPAQRVVPRSRLPHGGHSGGDGRAVLRPAGSAPRGRVLRPGP